MAPGTARGCRGVNRQKPLKNLKLMEALNSDPSLGWDQRELTYKETEWAAQFGVERQLNVVHLFLDDSRSLIIKTTSDKAGLALFLIPFSESRTYQVKLVRADASWLW